MTRKELGRKIYEVSCLEGSFILRSGKKSNVYFDKYRFLSNPVILVMTGHFLGKMVVDSGNIPSYIAYLEMGAMPLALASRMAIFFSDCTHSGIKSLFIRKKRKKYGTCRMVEGDYEDLGGKRVDVVEDIITTGGAVINAVLELRAMGAIVKNVYCVIDREEPKGIEGIGLTLRSLFTKTELKSYVS